MSKTLRSSEKAYEDVVTKQGELQVKLKRTVSQAEALDVLLYGEIILLDRYHPEEITTNSES